MNTYVDASVILRILFGQENQLAEWSEITYGVSSELVRVECLRTIDRAAIRARLGPAQVAALRASALELLGRLSQAAISSAVLSRASEPYPTPLGTLDAIHLATALALSSDDQPLVMATHDDELALAARAVGLRVVGA